MRPTDADILRSIRQALAQYRCAARRDMTRAGHEPRQRDAVLRLLAREQRAWLKRHQTALLADARRQWGDDVVH